MNNYISIRVILDNLMNHPLLRDLTFERAVNYTLQFIQLVGIPTTYIDKIDKIKVKNYRAVLPCDYNKMIQVRECVSNTPLRYTTDTFHMSDNKSDSFDITYKIQGKCLFCSMKDCELELSYKAMAVDEEGYPLIPDHPAFINALELYIKLQCFTILFDLGKIPQQALLNTQQEYAWAVGLALASMIMPSMDEMESISNSINTLLVRQAEHGRGFVNNGTKERTKLH